MTKFFLIIFPLFFQSAFAMDAQLRELERAAEAQPEDKTASGRLVTARRRAGDSKAALLTILTRFQSALPPTEEELREDVFTDSGVWFEELTDFSSTLHLTERWNREYFFDLVADSNPVALRFLGLRVSDQGAGYEYIDNTVHRIILSKPGRWVIGLESQNLQPLIAFVDGTTIHEEVFWDTVDNVHSRALPEALDFVINRATARMTVRQIVNECRATLSAMPARQIERPSLGDSLKSFATTGFSWLRKVRERVLLSKY